MGGGDLNMKKSWHPGLHVNQERVWKQEKKALEERKKLQDLRRERQQEREMQELQRLQEEAGGKKRSEKLDWMYAAPASASAPSANDLEDYLLGKKRVDQMLQGDEAQKVSKTDQSSFISLQNANTSRDTAVKIREDPMLAIKQQEQAAYDALLRDPTRLRQMRQKAGLPSDEAESSEERRRRKEERRRRKEEKRSSHARSHREHRRQRSESRDRDEERRHHHHRSDRHRRQPDQEEAARRDRSRRSADRDMGSDRHRSDRIRDDRDDRSRGWRDSRRDRERHGSGSLPPRDGGSSRRTRDDGRGDDDRIDRPRRDWPSPSPRRASRSRSPPRRREYRPTHTDWPERRQNDSYRPGPERPPYPGGDERSYRPGRRDDAGQQRSGVPGERDDEEKEAERKREAERHAKLEEMMSNAKTLETKRSEYLSKVQADEAAAAAREDELRAKLLAAKSKGSGDGKGSFLMDQQRKVLSDGGDLGDRLRRGRGGLQRLE